MIHYRTKTKQPKNYARIDSAVSRYVNVTQYFCRHRENQVSIETITDGRLVDVERGAYRAHVM